ncbi:M20/M25/M40 family metallo-hydrolase [Agromyces aerolatus]|uniref:M20/M25/M40 family metallo-hydrolase n=1 Tax=Agromyces sp. LY-1074 TaxID=3074080 RepID=UPI002866B284|nr:MULTISPECIES: M20/M25/M40 family metallo-hydrolase [unclassified Agromyces]MDR5699157.1 M20/M25/M40 family metallo-hydrolase [Agromyces sp. LY-1074]MDR5705452.1 M20/M25/M40 family metallo-hydrolase [Agromyces sp. LY-1358]
MSTGAARAHDFLAAHERQLAEDLMRWVAIPSVAGDPDLTKAVTWSAAELAARCREAGFPLVELWAQGDGHAVFAEWVTDASLPTVFVYSHHDVRAVKHELWRETDPFTPVERGGRVFGRGTSDAKGQVLAHLWGLRAHLAATGRDAPAVNLRWLIEGEEELGSPNLAALLDEHRDRIGGDLVVFTDTMLLDADHPAVSLSIRGMVGATLTVFGPQHDVHSGAVSGAAPDPTLILARTLAALCGEDGRVTLPGFYDDVEPHEDLRAELAELPFDEADWVERSRTDRIVGEPGYTVPERLWIRPALDVIEIRAGDVDGRPRAVIPRSATASISVRLVDAQRPEKVANQLDRWLAERMPRDQWSLEVTLDTAGPPYRTPHDHPAVIALAEAMAEAWDVPVAAVGRMGNGGGGPADLLARVVGAPVVFFGTGLVEDHWHAPDESVSLEMLRKGAASIAAWLPRLAEALPARR